MTPHQSDKPAATRFAKFLPLLWRRVLPLAITLVLLLFFWRWLTLNINQSLLAQNLARIPLSAVAASTAINIAILGIYGYRMSLLLKAGYLQSFGVVNLGYAVNAILPFRIGDAAKIYFARVFYHIGVGRLIAATFIEKLFDLAALACLALAVFAFATNRLLHVEEAVLPALIVVGGVAAFIAFKFFVKSLNRFLPRDSALKTAILAVHSGSTYPLWRVLFMTLLIWVATVYLIYFTINSLLPGIGFGFIDAVAMLIIAALAIAIPATPAGIGIFETGILIYLTRFFHVSNETALAVAVVFHLIINVPQIIYSIGLLIRHHLTDLAK